MINSTVARQPQVQGHRWVSEPQPEWVSAAPFRAHVSHLIQNAEVPWPVVAYQAGVPQAALRTLMQGRQGRVRTKISQDLASRLINLRPQDLHWMRTSQVNAQRTATRIRNLRTAGKSWSDIARFLTIDVATCAAIARGERSCVSVMIEVLAHCACAQAGLPTWEDSARRVEDDGN
ncbi:MAG: hypothetical protein FWG15_08560 [Propionibacteriaceae bacterium]|nr:hypothetical protein [Propionibacteriaceae bacterium]